MIYCINNGVINIYHYKLVANDENKAVMYACNQHEIDTIKEYWENQLHHTLTVEEIDNSEYSWMEGIPVEEPEEAESIMNRGESVYLDSKYSPSLLDSVKELVNIIFSTAKVDTETVLKISGLLSEYAPGNHTKGEIYKAYGQVWECIQNFDTNTYPDIYPLSDAWFTFNKPYHGRSAETARPWLKPEHGTTDMYLKDEYMIYTDDQVYKCLRDTVYSPEEYAADWEKQ